MNTAPGQKPPIPTTITIVAVLAAVLLIGGAFWLGRTLGTPSEPEPTETAPPALTLPEQIGDYQRATATEPTNGPEAGREVVRANYTDGTNEVLFALARPETEIEEFLTNAGITDLTERAAAGSTASGDESSSTMCGTSVDTGFPACGRIVEGTGQLMVAVTEVPAEDILALLELL